MNIAQIGILRNIPTKFQLNPFSSFGGVVSTTFEFNRQGRLEAVTQQKEHRNDIKGRLELE